MLKNMIMQLLSEPDVIIKYCYDSFRIEFEGEGFFAIVYFYDDPPQGIFYTELLKLIELGKIRVRSINFSSKLIHKKND